MPFNLTSLPTGTFPRVSGRKGSTIRLNVTFYANGVATDPYAIREINIYRNSASATNLVDTIQINTLPGESAYPSPLVQCETGEYYYDYLVPDDLVTPDSYVDEWSFIGDALEGEGGTTGDIDFNDQTLWDQKCGRFFLNNATNFCLDDGLIVPRIGFEALDVNLQKDELRSIEVGMMPLPLYDYDFNLISPMIPHIVPTYTLETLNHECIVNDGPALIGLRQGLHRTSPFVVRFQIDTSQFIIGTYQYKIKLQLPNGETRVSPNFKFSIN